MSIASNINNVGATVLRLSHGEPLVIRGIPMVGIVTRNPTANWATGEKNGKNPQFLGSNFSTIEIKSDMLALLSSDLKSGDIIVSVEDSQVHRIQEFSNIEFLTVFLCKSSASSK